MTSKHAEKVDGNSCCGGGTWCIRTGHDACSIDCTDATASESQALDVQEVQREVPPEHEQVIV
ncbi:hypothetical protein [Alicyclobacillus dauci]|uniref:Uncharacterized protein n=1 Tax=Alicyclobacillus dauci TaxID=1475485 RepID=A0ABY6Z6U4_9BACL|nr:hypothetical protein [Alicyclobacillus dauci]WAH38595.1 hypothetical protein NZD86_08985 [Alicyclobacillus dauci]